MKLATLRRRSDAPPGITGVARVDRRTVRLAGRLRPGEIAVIDHVDLDRVSAEALVAARPAVIINAQPSISGRYPNLGPEVIAAAGIPLVDDVGTDVFAAIKDGARVRVEGDTVYAGEAAVASGTAHDLETVTARMVAAREGLTTQLEAFTVDTAEFLRREHGLLLDDAGVPNIRTRLAGKHVVVVVRGSDAAKDLKALKHYLREYKPVLIGVDGGADVLLDAGHAPDLIVGDMDAVSDAALGSGAEVVAHAYRDGRIPGLPRVQDLGVDAVPFPTSASSEDVALLLAGAKGAAVVVTVGASANLDEFLDRGRSGMASAFLTRLRLGAKLVDARTVHAVYRTRISAVALVFLVLAALAAAGAMLAATDAGQTYLSALQHGWDSAVRWIQDVFS
jgi:uncharacterized membrane-anchored protein